MYPRPPTWIKSRIIKCPKEVKSTGVSLTISPVTQTADVAVNIASIKRSSPLCENGSERRAAPKKISPIKLKSIILIS
jgi:hypothetical protein